MKISSATDLSIGKLMRKLITIKKHRTPLQKTCIVTFFSNGKTELVKTQWPHRTTAWQLLGKFSVLTPSVGAEITLLQNSPFVTGCVISSSIGVIKKMNLSN